MGEDAGAHVPVTYESCAHISGPFFHESKSALAIGDELVPGYGYRTRSPLRVVGEVDDWKGHDPEVLKEMLDRLATLREQGLDVIED